VITLDHLLRLRVVIARVGEMDNARWWNTNGQLGTIGATVLQRNFPRTYRFAAARSVFAVARARCNELFNPPKSITLWNLPAAIEDEFDAKWEAWVERREEWEPFFAEVAALSATSDPADVLRRLNLVTAADEEAVRPLQRSVEARAVQLPGLHVASDELLRRLSLGFSKGGSESLTIPYARLED
jgi:hypothetical protein